VGPVEFDWEAYTLVGLDEEIDSAETYILAGQDGLDWEIDYAVVFDWEIGHVQAYVLLSPDECPVEALGWLAVGMTSAGPAADDIAAAELDFRSVLAGSGAQWNSGE